MLGVDFIQWGVFHNKLSGPHTMKSCLTYLNYGCICVWKRLPVCFGIEYNPNIAFVNSTHINATAAGYLMSTTLPLWIQHAVLHAGYRCCHVVCDSGTTHVAIVFIVYALVVWRFTEVTDEQLVVFDDSWNIKSLISSKSFSLELWTYIFGDPWETWEKWEKCRHPWETCLMTVENTLQSRRRVDA